VSLLRACASALQFIKGTTDGVEARMVLAPRMGGRRVTVPDHLASFIVQHGQVSLLRWWSPTQARINFDRAGSQDYFGHAPLSARPFRSGSAFPAPDSGTSPTPPVAIRFFATARNHAAGGDTSVRFADSLIGFAAGLSASRFTAEGSPRFAVQRKALSTEGFASDRL